MPSATRVWTSARAAAPPGAEWASFSGAGDSSNQLEKSFSSAALDEGFSFSFTDAESGDAVLVEVVPEPASLALAATGGVLLLGRRRPA